MSAAVRFGVALSAAPSFVMSIWAGILARDVGLGLVSVQMGVGSAGLRSSLTCLMVSSLTGTTPWLIIAVAVFPWRPSLM